MLSKRARFLLGICRGTIAMHGIHTHHSDDDSMVGCSSADDEEDDDMLTDEVDFSLSCLKHSTRENALIRQFSLRPGAPMATVSDRRQAPPGQLTPLRALHGLRDPH